MTDSQASTEIGTDSPAASIAEPANSNNENTFSTIFQRLVPESDDIVGLVAYGIFKQSKRDWVIRHQRQHGQKPNDVERQRFHDHFSDDDLQRFRSEAEARLVDFAEAYFQSRRPDIENQIRAVEFANTKSEIINTIHGQTKFRTSVLAGVVAWALSVFVIVVGILVMNYSVVLSAVKQALGIPT